VGDAPQYDDVTLIVLGATTDDVPPIQPRVRRRDEPTQTVKR